MNNIKLHPKQKKMITDIMLDDKLFRNICRECRWEDGPLEEFLNAISNEKNMDEYYRYRISGIKGVCQAKKYLNEMRETYLIYLKKTNNDKKKE